MSTTMSIRTEVTNTAQTLYLVEGCKSRHNSPQKPEAPVPSHLATYSHTREPPEQLRLVHRLQQNLGRISIRFAKLAQNQLKLGKGLPIFVQRSTQRKVGSVALNHQEEWLEATK